MDFHAKWVHKVLKGFNNKFLKISLMSRNFLKQSQLKLIESEIYQWQMFTQVN